MKTPAMTARDLLRAKACSVIGSRNRKVSLYSPSKPVL
eukprot:CAMPEP_0113990296 /NCGR_PEP_ID=MMETSP0328-20130328/8481_1 /TAXON_ID=39455 /ORGANISM="Alexandrium minutum" /LENGTH=37 /assembly_acc=CAM_ASM_000350